MIRVATAGESHGPCLTVVVEGLPAGLALDGDMVRADLARRQIPLGAGGRMAIETDRAEITSGVMAGVTTGAPVAMTIANADHASWKGRAVAAYTAPRPGHADFAAVVKYGYDDIRPALERASARETASRVAAGACCRALLREFGIEVGGEVETIGLFVKGGTPEAERCIQQARRAGDTLGGVISATATGVPAGLGSHVSADRRLDGRLAAAVMSIPAIKGVEIGGGFRLDRDSGGVTGGISDDSAPAEDGRSRDGQAVRDLLRAQRRVPRAACGRRGGGRGVHGARRRASGEAGRRLTGRNEAALRGAAANARA